MMDQKLVRRCIAAWVILWSAMVYAYGAAVPAFSQEMRNYDYESILWAAGFALGAGIWSTVLSLMSKKIFVLGFWRTMTRNLVFAVAGGAATYIIFLWLQTVSPSIFNKELRLVVIVIVGASNGRWKDTLGDLVADAVQNARTKVRGAPLPAPADSPPPSATMPLSDK